MTVFTVVGRAGVALKTRTKVSAIGIVTGRVGATRVTQYDTLIDVCKMKQSEAKSDANV